MAPSASKASSSSSDPKQPKSWASIVSPSEDDLHFIEESLDAVVDGVLKIPMAVVEKGVAKLRRAMVGQFVGEGPPTKVIRLVVNWLWGFVRCSGRVNYAGRD
ncbi:hypothetical protein LINPERHAP1_LOCUS19314 [Linum perenne]